MDEKIAFGCFVAKQTIGSRITLALFPRQHLMPPEEPEEARMLAEGFAPGELSIDTHIKLGPLDRLRVLLSGKLVVPHRVATDKIVGKMHTRSTVYVQAPWEPWK